MDLHYCTQPNGGLNVFTINLNCFRFIPGGQVQAPKWEIFDSTSSALPLDPSNFLTF